MGIRQSIMGGGSPGRLIGRQNHGKRGKGEERREIRDICCACVPVLPHTPEGNSDEPKGMESCLVRPRAIV